MRKLLPLILLICSPAFATNVHQAQFGVGTTFNFVLYNTDGTLDTDEVDGGAEVSLSCDEGAEGTATNDFVDEGTFYSIALTAAEMECARIAVIVAATDTNVFFIETFGDTRAQNKVSGVASGIAQASTSTTIVFESDTAIGNDDILIGRVVCITEGTGLGQCRLITDYANASDTATVSTWDTTPSTDSGYVVLTGNQASTSTFANAVADQVWDEATSGHTSAGTFGEQVKTDIDAILTDTGTTLPSTLSTIQASADSGVVYDSTVAAVESQTELDVDSGDDPGANDFHIGQVLCVEDADDSSTQDCAEITDFDSTNDRWTIDAALDFTVEVGDKLWIPAPVSVSVISSNAGSDVWQVTCEDQGTGYTCQETMSLLLSEAGGTCVYNSTTRVWTCKDPGGNETRWVITMGSDLDGDRDSSTATPMTP